MIRVSVLSIALALCGCGGVIDNGDAAPGPDASKPDSEQQDTDAQTCSSLLNELAGQVANAIQCCPTCNITQCEVLADGLCCPLVVSSGTSDAVNIYEATLAQINIAHCPVTCPDIPCPPVASGICSMSGSCSQQ